MEEDVKILRYKDAGNNECLTLVDSKRHIITKFVADLKDETVGCNGLVIDVNMYIEDVI